MKSKRLLCGSSAVLMCVCISSRCTYAVEAPIRPELRVGRAGHAFDHLGEIDEQVVTAAASGATIIYGTGLGAFGYQGLPPADQLAATVEKIRAYKEEARRHGIELVFGYVCATSIVGLDAFDQNWSPELRAHFRSPPAEWRQVGRDGQPLASWYGGEYHPACMNHPDWRAYERYMVRQQLATGDDGIFFDNPTVHPQGCYCAHCMGSFARFLKTELPAAEMPAAGSPDEIESLRRLADAHAREFLRFRSTIARDFLAHIREYARTIKPDALITCNNSLNSPGVLYSQCRTFGYNIAELSKAEDLVVVEDMVAQPRVEADGRMFEYGPTYKQLHAISRGKPVVAVTLANADYHTPPNLVRLAMAEAAAHNASYLSWPTWPEEQRQRMSAAIRPQADLLRRHESLLNDAHFRTDVVLFLPFRRWVETEECKASSLAAALAAANIQYAVISESNFGLPQDGAMPAVFLVETLAVLTPEEKAAVDAFQAAGGRLVTAGDPAWMDRLSASLEDRSVVLAGPSTVRVVVQDQPDRTTVHIYNLHIQRISPFEDKVTPANDLDLAIAVPFHSVRKVTAHSADDGTRSGPIDFTTERAANNTRVRLKIPRLEVSAILTIER